MLERAKTIRIVKGQYYSITQQNKLTRQDKFRSKENSKTLKEYLIVFIQRELAYESDSNLQEIQFT